MIVLQTSAHKLHGVKDGRIQLIATSPPFLGLRQYAGDQDVEWPTVVFRLNEWTEPITVQGCEPGCVHEWVEGPVVNKKGLEKSPSDTLNGNQWPDARCVQSGRYCRHCGGWRGPLGLETTPVAYIGHLILCLREWRRVLRDDGVVFVNLGDSYATGTTAGRPAFSPNGRVGANNPLAQNSVGRLGTPDGLKTKDLIGIPWMFALAARADGWYLRSEIIWAKGVSFLPSYAGSVMPESVEDRATRAHEQVFMLTKSPRYFYDSESVREVSIMRPQNRTTDGRGKKDDGYNDHRKAPGMTDPGSRNLRDVWAIDNTLGEFLRWVDDQGVDVASLADRFAAEQAGQKDTWVITPQPYKKAHYAVWPEKLVAPMIRCATSERGACPTCGAPWRRVVERTAMVIDRSHNHPPELRTRTSGTMVEPAKSTTLGWLPTCACYGIPPMPEYPDEPEKPKDIDDEAPEICVKCEGLGYLPGLPMFPDDHQTCPKCEGTKGKEATPKWLAWRAEQDAWQAECDRIMEEEIKPFLAVAQDLPTVPCIVMDPFSGSGTTAGVALKLGREAVAIDISAEYLREHVPGRTTVQVEVPLL